MRRVWTPDQILPDRSVQLASKRICDGCGSMLGDLTDPELVAVWHNRRQKSVRSQCAHCLGFHVLFADPAAREPGADSVVLTLKVLCPGKPDGVPVEPCAEWARCGCVPPAGVEPLSTEWERFMSSPCPSSPTGEHRYLIERDEPGGPYVGAPVPGTCWYANRFREHSNPPALVAHIVTGPGKYPVEGEMVDMQTVHFEPVEMFHGHRAEVVPV
jgi:hypothetical protein